MRKERHPDVKREFFELQNSADRSWYDMIQDAPADYSPKWIDRLQEGKLRDYLRQVYLELREEQAKDGKVSVLRDLLIRRLVWCARICDRIEQAMDKAEGEIMADVKGAENKLFLQERYYRLLTQTMLEISYHLHRTGPKPKRKPSPHRLGAGTVDIPDVSEL